MTAAHAVHAVQISAPRPDATVIAYGIAHAGAGAAVWNPVAAAAPATLEVRGLRLPGRENRIRTSPHRFIAAAATEIAEILLQQAQDHGKRIMVVGACSGALLGLAALSAAGRLLDVVGLVALRQPTPVPPVPHPDGVTAMSPLELRIWLRSNDLTPAAVLDDDLAFEFFEPLLRADLALIEEYRFQGAPVGCPIYLPATAGSARPPVPAAWQPTTSAAVTVLEIPGTGDLLVDRPAQLAAVLGTLA